MQHNAIEKEASINVAVCNGDYNVNYFYSPQFFEANLKPTLFFFLLLLSKTFRENQEYCAI